MKKRKKRWDGEEILLSPYQKLESHLIHDRIEATIYNCVVCDLSITSQALKDHHLSLFSYTIACLVKTLDKYPEVNRFVLNNRLYQRNHIAISTVIKKRLTKEGKSIVIKESFDPTQSIVNLNEQLKKTIFSAKQTEEFSKTDKLMEFLGKLPHFMIRTTVSLATRLNQVNLLPKSIAKDDPLHASCIFANLGSIDLPAPFHHLYHWGTISLFVVIGKVDSTAQTVECTFSVDERIADGFILSRAFLYFKKLMENPECMFKDETQSQ